MTFFSSHFLSLLIPSIYPHSLSTYIQSLLPLLPSQLFHPTLSSLSFHSTFSLLSSLSPHSNTYLSPHPYFLTIIPLSYPCLSHQSLRPPLSFFLHPSLTPLYLLPLSPHLNPLSTHSLTPSLSLPSPHSHTPIYLNPLHPLSHPFLFHTTFSLTTLSHLSLTPLSHTYFSHHSLSLLSQTSPYSITALRSLFPLLSFYLLSSPLYLTPPPSPLTLHTLSPHTPHSLSLYPLTPHYLPLSHPTLSLPSHIHLSLYSLPTHIHSLISHTLSLTPLSHPTSLSPHIPLTPHSLSSLTPTLSLL